jgi:endonuclease IV
MFVDFCHTFLATIRLESEEIRDLMNKYDEIVSIRESNIQEMLTDLDKQVKKCEELTKLLSDHGNNVIDKEKLAETLRIQLNELNNQMKELEQTSKDKLEALNKNQHQKARKDFES